MATLVSNVGNLVSEMLNPVGTVIQGPITSAPTGYLLCNGQAVDRTTYSKLFDVIGTNFGSGDGSTTFNVPDYRGCFLRGLGGASGTLYAKQEQGLPNITGATQTGNIWGATTNNGRGALYSVYVHNNTPDGGGVQIPSGDVYIDASRSSAIYGASENVTPVNYAVQYFIKY